ncbi:MAG: family transposase [Candidatus Poribacteria bacterium]|nr:family transposase [Candidatus Poribacteria bacterium]
MASPVYGKSTYDIRKWLIKSKCRISKGVRARKACRQTDPPTGGVKKTLQLLSIPVARKRELVRELSDTYDAKMLCNLIGIPKSSYYYVPDSRDDMEIRASIERACLKYPRYGYRRIASVLRREGIYIGKERVRLIMKDMGLQVRRHRRRIRTTISIGSTPYPNLLKNLDIVYPDHVWCGDISYISLADGSTAYLAILMDIYTRMIRGWSLRRDLTESLVHEALSKALQTGHIPGIHHSDQGVQYTANGYDCRLLELDVKISMAGKGRAWENPFAESVIGHLKDEEVWVKEYVDFRDAYTNLCYFLDVFYNHERIHSSLGYMTPSEFESQYWSQRNQNS